MHKTGYGFLLLLVCLSIFSCSSSQSVLQTSDISGYDKTNKDHIIFLNFKISDQGKGRNEKVKLVRATSGNGRMKNLRSAVHYPYQIKVIPRYNAGHLETEMVFEHPLFRSVEIPNQNGSLDKLAVTARQGTLSFRFQEDNTMERIEFFSVTPERGSVKIYTLNLKI